MAILPSLKTCTALATRAVLKTQRLIYFECRRGVINTTLEQREDFRTLSNFCNCAIYTIYDSLVIYGAQISYISVAALREHARRRHRRRNACVCRIASHI